MAGPGPTSGPLTGGGAAGAPPEGEAAVVKTGEGPSSVTYHFSSRVASFLREDHYAGLLNIDAWMALYDRVKVFTRMAGVAETLQRGPSDEENDDLYLDQLFAQYDGGSWKLNAGRLFVLTGTSPLSLDGVSGSARFSKYLSLDAYSGWPVLSTNVSSEHDPYPAVGLRLSSNPTNGLLLYTLFDYRKPREERDDAHLGFGASYALSGVGSLSGNFTLDPTKGDPEKAALRLGVLTNPTWRLFTGYTYDANPLEALLQGHPLATIFPSGQVFVDGTKVSEGPESSPQHLVDLGTSFAIPVGKDYRFDITAGAGVLLRNGYDGYQLSSDIAFLLLTHPTAFTLSALRRASEAEGNFNQFTFRAKTQAGPVVFLLRGWLDYLTPPERGSGSPTTDVPNEYYIPSPGGGGFVPASGLSGGGEFTLGVPVGADFFIEPTTWLRSHPGHPDISALVLLAWRPRSEDSPGIPLETAAIEAPAPVSLAVLATGDPFKFNHWTHASKDGEEMECGECHEPTDAGSGMSIPTIKICASCHISSSDHQGAVTAMKSGEQTAFMSFVNDEDHECGRCHSHPEKASGPQLPPSLVSFSHKKHPEIGCATCHSGATESKSAEDNLKPTMAVCSTCHTDILQKQSCSKCHGTDELTLKFIPHYETASFSGDTYLDMDEDCSTCHQDSINVRPTMASCGECHESKIKSLERGKCSFCHELKSPGQRPRRIDHSIYAQHQEKPLELLCATCHEDSGRGFPTIPPKGAQGTCNTCHTDRQVTVHKDSGWKSLHQFMATFTQLTASAVPRAECSDCHTQVDTGIAPTATTTCQQCHSPRSPLQAYSLNHRGDFESHPMKFWANPSECSTCHQGSSTCLDCHSKESLTPTTRSPSDKYHGLGWIDQWSGSFHGKDPRTHRIGAGCATACHTGSSCKTCH